MFHLATSTLTHLLASYGYLVVLVFVALESTSIPFPGETILLVAAIAAGMTHQLSIAWVIVAAAGGAILGDNLGFWLGREGGSRLLRRYGRYIHLEERRLKLGQYLFLKHGGKAERALPGPLDLSFARGKRPGEGHSRFAFHVARRHPASHGKHQGGNLPPSGG